MKSITRRNFLKSSGALLALPALGASAAKSKAPVRFVGMYHTNGVNPYKWFPTTAGPDYEMPENVALLSDLRDDTTMISGAAHWKSPQSAGHSGITNFLTGCGNGSGVAFHTSQSLDQYLAPTIGKGTRIESLSLSWRSGVGNLGGGIHTMSFGPYGNPIPAISSPKKIFEMLFVEPTAAAKEKFRYRLGNNRSILDNLMEESKDLNRRLGKQDREKLDEYLTNVRRVETLMVREGKWLDVPRHEVDAKLASKLMAADRHDLDLMIELMYLALVSDSTRVITYVPMSEGGLYHATSHWNKNPEKLLPLLDEWDRKWIGALGKLGTKLKATAEGEGSYLDRTVILYGGGHGRKPHYAHDLPALVMGGKSLGIQHGQHLAFQHLEDANIRGREKAEDFRARTKIHRKVPLCNAHVSLANALGVETAKFGDSTGAMDGLLA